MRNSTAGNAVNETRLWQRHMDMGRIGGTAKGGVNRQALSAEDAQARAQLVSWANARGFAHYVDEIGNLYIRRNGSEPNIEPVLTGSHLDSQPTGGKFDGTYGVLAGLEVLEALEDAQIPTKRSIEVVAWTNEEGSRFQPGTMGSAIFARMKPLDEMLAVQDAQGVSVATALQNTLKATPGASLRASGFPVSAYIEAHIEQGPRLVNEEKTIGVVSGIQGSRWFEIIVRGEEAHAGTTPLAARKDALRSAIAIVNALQELMADPADILRFTVGRFEVAPGSPNTVPGQVLFTIDFRHPDRSVLKARGDKVAEICTQAAGLCTVSVKETIYNDPTIFDPEIVGLVQRVTERYQFPYMVLPSGAGHDARSLSPLCPTGMIFVPCEKGISHNEAENATSSDLAAGTRVLAGVLVELANR